jgi:hypothetical protein
MKMKSQLPLTKQLGTCTHKPDCKDEEGNGKTKEKMGNLYLRRMREDAVPISSETLS